MLKPGFAGILCFAGISAAACSAAPSDAAADDPSEWEVAASAESSARLGVGRWVMKSTVAGQAEIRGIDSEGAAIMRFAVVVQRESTSAYRLMLGADVDDRTSKAFALVDDGGNVAVLQNELAGNVRVAQAIERIDADFQRAAGPNGVGGGGSLGGGGGLVSSAIASAMLRPLGGGEELVAPPGKDLVCTWNPGGNKLVMVAKCGMAIVSCGGTLAEPEIAPVSAVHCGGSTIRCGESVMDVASSKEPHYDCTTSDCDPCGSEPSLYPGTGGRNPSSTQRQCYNSYMGTWEQDCRLEGKCETITDAKVKEWQTKCGCNKACTGNTPYYSGGGPKG